MPLWLDEGFAEFIQNTEIRNKDARLGEPSVADILYLRQNRLLPLPTLFKVDASSPLLSRGTKSVSLLCRVLGSHPLPGSEGPRERHHRIPNYVSPVRQHQDPVVAAETAFGDLKKLESALESYIRAGHYKDFIVFSAAAPLDEASYQSKPLTQAHADADRADFLAYVQRTADARSLLETLLKAEYDNAQAHETLGYLAYRERDADAARKWYGEAVRLNSQSFLANYSFATLSIHGGNLSNEAEVEACLRAAIPLNPGFAPAYDQLAGLLAMRHENLVEAHFLNVNAIELDPGNLAYRMNAATVLMNMSRYNDAAAVPRNVAKAAKNPHEKQILQSELKQIESIQALGAKPSAMITAPPTGQVEIETAEKLIEVVSTAKHPTEKPDGPKHMAVGLISKVQCSYPAELEFQVETAKKPSRSIPTII
jgi:tetratricopeptide (TPR) repeat protein